MLADELTILTQLESRVRNYKRKTQYLWNWSCDICGDSAVNQRKARFYASQKKGSILCYCHNCGFSGSLLHYLREKHPDLASQFSVETFKKNEVTLFSYSKLINSKGVSDDTLASLFYMDKHENPSDWVNYLKSKRITIDDDDFKKLASIHVRVSKKRSGSAL